MKVNQQTKALTFGEFIAVVYDVWGQQRAGGIVRLAVNARFVKFQGLERFVFSKEKPTCRHVENF
jgi:hypothetical protein